MRSGRALAVPLHAGEDRGETEERTRRIFTALPQCKLFFLEKLPVTLLLQAAALLEENNAAYPDKISYTNPQHLSLEALEIHYRVHASILKYLELHEGKPILSSVGKVFKKCLNTSSLPKKNYNNKQQKVGEAEKKDETKAGGESKDGKSADVNEQLIMTDVKECMDSMLQKIEQQGAKKTTEETVISLSDSDDDKKKSELSMTAQFS